MLATRSIQTSASVKDVETAAKFIGAGAATVGCAGTALIFKCQAFLFSENFQAFKTTQAQTQLINQIYSQVSF